MKCIVLTLIRVFLFVLTLSLISCSEPPEPIRIGVVLPLTGDFQIYGNAGVQGAKLAVKEINQSGGVLGRQVELLIKDNKTNPSLSVQHGRHLIQAEQVLALMGPVSSSARNAMVEVASSLKTPLLYGIDYEGEQFDPYLFCYSNTPYHYITPVVPWMMDKFGKKVYIFGYDYIWPHNLAKVVEQEVPANDGTIVGKEFTAFGVSDFSSTLQKIKARNASVLVLILPGKDGFEFIRQFNQYGLQGKVKILAIAAGESYLSAMPAEQLEGIYTGLHYFASIQSDAAKEFIQNYQKEYGKESVPTYSTVAHYELIKLFARAVKQSGSLDQETIIASMENQQFQTPSGMVHSRQDHHFDLPMYLAEFSQGQLLVREDLGVITPPDQRKGK